MISEKIRVLRKQAQLSQEQLAEKLNVSRQAVTKWETGSGVPDIENLRALSILFGVSLDELLETGNETLSRKQEYLYESFTEYDMEYEKHYDIAFSGAKQVSLLGCEGEKIRVRLSSNLISDIQSSMKVKIDDIRKRIDIDIKRLETLTEAKAKEALFITIWLPRQYTKQIELAGSTQALCLRQLALDSFEFTGKLQTAEIADTSGHIELNSNDDIEVSCFPLDGCLDINQVSATSRLYLPEGTVFASAVRGFGNHIFYEKGGVSCDDFSQSGDEVKSCENVIELNGMKSELIINAVPKEA